MRLTKTSKVLWAALLAMSVGMACSKKKSDDGEQSTTVNFSGSLALTASSPSTGDALPQFGLATTSYDLYCVTFSIPPTAGSVSITDNVFNAAMDGFANNSFGCFIRADGAVKGTVVFESETAGIDDTTLLVSAGDLVFDIYFDPVTGLATAKIKSLPGDAQQDGGAFSGGDLTGYWQIGCDQDTATALNLGCDMPKLTEDGGMRLYMHHQVDNNIVGIWQDEAAYNACIKGGNEYAPSLSYNISGKDYDIDFTNIDTFKTSVDAVYAKLPAELKDALYSSMDERMSSMFGWCNNLHEYTTTNCKLIVPEDQCWDQWDAETNTSKQVCYPKWYGPDETLPAAYTGTATQTSVECRYKDDPSLSHITNWCDWETQNADTDQDGLSTMNIYVDENGKQIMMACTFDDGNSGSYVEQQPAPAATIAAAVKLRTPPGQEQCEDAAAPYTGLKVGAVDELRRTVLDLFRNQNYGPEGGDSCSMYTVPSGFDFSQCASNYNTAACWGGGEHMGLKKSTDGKKWVTDTTYNQQWLSVENSMQDEFCPTKYAAVATDSNGYKQWDTTSTKACLDEFAAKTAAQQAEFFIAMSLNWNLVDKLACGSDSSTTIKDLIADARSSSCSAEIRYEMMWFNGVVETSLQCHGTETGACYDAEGNFLGRLTGRHAVMKLKPKGGSAFELAEISKSTWNEWRPAQETDAGKSAEQILECSSTHGTIINSKMIDADNFGALFSSSESSVCYDKATGAEAGESQNNGGSKGNEGPYAWLFTRVVE